MRFHKGTSFLSGVNIVRINNNITTLKTENQVNQNDKSLHQTIFVNDDSATKVALSDNSRNNTREKTQKLIDTQNDISALQTVDDALHRIHSILRTGKEISMESTTTQESSIKQALQNQITTINQSIDRISNSVQHNTPLLLDRNSESRQNDNAILYALKSDWLSEGEDVIMKRYGLTGDGANIDIVLDEGYQPYLAAVYSDYDKTGKAGNLAMHIAVETALPAILPNGGSYPGQYDDRVITHEMVHVLMGRTMNAEILPNWFQEGAAEFIHGPDERVFHDLARNGGGITGATKIQNALGDGTNGSWVNDSLHYSMAGMAVRYLHEKIKEDGHSGGIRDLLTDLKDHPDENLDKALSHVSKYGNVHDFVGDFVKKGNGAIFISELNSRGEFRNAILGGDTGAICGANADNGPIQTAESVIPDTIHTTNTPLKYFHVTWPTLATAPTLANTPESEAKRKILLSTLKFDSAALKTDSVDLVNNPRAGKIIFDNALSYVTTKQTQLQEIQQKLHYQVNEFNAAINNADIQDRFESVKKDLSKLNSNFISSFTTPRPERVLQMLKTY